MKKLVVYLFILTVLLIAIGLIIVLIASSSISEIKYSDSFYLFKLHLYKVIWAIPALLIAAIIPFEFYKYLSKFLIIGITIVLILTLFTAAEYKGAARWFSILDFQFQPADPAKLLLVIHLAYLLDKKVTYLDDFSKGYLPLLFWISIISVLILIQPNVSNAILILFTSIFLIYVGGVPKKFIIATVSVILIIITLIVVDFPHAKTRIESYINFLTTGSDINIQVKQALISLGSGGIFRLGLGDSRQSDLFLPEAYGDFIYGIIGEQFGFIGTLSVLLIYLVIVLIGFNIAKKTTNRFGQLVVFGISTQITFFALVNIAVTTGLLPTTGLPLPFISYGGTSIIFNSIGIGIIINVAITDYINQLEKNNIVRKKDTNDKKFD